MNSFPSYARSAALAAFAALVSGCGGPNPEKEFSLGAAAFEARDYAKASAHYRKGLEAKPGDVDALVMLARSELAAGEVAAAGGALAQASETNPDDPDVLELSAQTAFYLKDFELARRLYTRLADGEGFDAKTKSAGWAGMGVVDYFLVDRTPGSPELRDRARTELLRALQLDRRNSSAHYHLGRLYRDSFGFLESAREEFDLYVHLEPASDPRVARTQRETMPALSEAIAAKAASRPGVAKRNAVACTESLKKADAFFRKGDWKSARLVYAEALSRDPLSYPAALGLARSWEKSGKGKAETREALKAYCQACDLGPSAISTLIAGGDTAMKLGNFATAERLYSRAVAASPANTTAIDGLIHALRKTGAAKSAAVYQRYRDTLPKRR